MPSNERVVSLSEIPEEQAKRMVSELDGAIDGVTAAIPVFKKDSRRGFAAEYCVQGHDVVIHFFLPKHAEPHLATPEGREKWMLYWLQRFPAKLDEIARSYFDAESPRLVAKYTEELASWWFKAQGFGDVINPDLLVQKFYERLDEALQHN